MKTLSFVLISFLISVSFLYPQNTDTAQIKQNTLKGKWGILFGIGYDFKLQSLDGGSFAAEFFLNNKSSLRLSLNVMVDYSKSKDEGSYDFGYMSYRNEQEYTLSVMYVMLFNTKSRFKLFSGIGPGFIFGINKTTREHNPDFYDTWDSKLWKAGLCAVVGVKWFPYDDISIFGEYAIGIYYGREYHTGFSIYRSTTRIFDVTNNLFNVSASTARLGLGIYF